ncbi:MAG: bacillithiol biosynthesis BshC, partial [Flavobacteriaceae bacterium]|nr:bacillithiol biosynthesis BshC [Flavobacteriaceae bacterium]
MKVETIPFYKTGYFSKLICDYLAKDDKLQPFYNNFPSIEGFKKQLEEKKESFSLESRNVLVNALSDQYKNVEKSEKTSENIEKLKFENTFTVVTGHQLNLFTGPLYFLYKIISTINLTEILKEEFPSYNFVPVYWMAT